MPKKSRAPGGGRKPRGEFRGNSKILTVRVRPEIRTALEQLAKRHRRSLSQEIQRGLDDWIGSHHKPKLHIGALAHMTTLLAEAIEQATGRRWHEDPFTGEALRQGVEMLIFHFAPASDGPAPVPLKIEEATEVAMRMPGHPWKPRTTSELGTSQAGMIITLIENAAADDKPSLRLERLKHLSDEQGFWKILRDIGSGWKTNRAVRSPRETRK
jgi:predicted transcriptional regulator